MVIATGANTWFGQLAGRVVSRKASRMPFSKGSAASVCADSLYAGDGSGGAVNQWLHQGDWWEAALFALSVAVGLTPECCR